MTPEAKVKKFIDDKMKKWYPDAVKYSPPAGMYGKAGFPDRLWFIKGNERTCIVVAIEAKADGNEATQLQMHTLVGLKEQGVLVAIVTGKDESTMNRIHQEIESRIEAANE